MDECIPSVIRDSKYFMYPFYYFAYGGRNIKQVMNYKKLVYGFSEEEYNEFYNNLNTISRNRLTDLNVASLKHILSGIDNTATSLIDIGCGNNYLLKKIKERYPVLKLFGADVKEIENSIEYDFSKANIESLPFDDNSFDIVTCTHTLEHILNPEKAVQELKRITGKQLIVVVPCQRYFFYTLDEHVNFFHYREKLTSLIDIKNYTCEKKWGDWVYIGYP